MAKHKLVNQKLVQKVDDKGRLQEVESSKTFSVKLDDSDKFVMVYYNMLKSFYQIKYVKDVMLLIKLVELANYNTGEVTIATKTRDMLCEQLDVRKSNLSPMFKRLVELELISGEKGVYKINEAAFWKGDSSVRQKILEDKGLEFILKFTV